MYLGLKYSQYLYFYSVQYLYFYQICTVFVFLSQPFWANSLNRVRTKYESRWGFWLTRFTWFRSTLSHMKSNITYSMIIKIIKKTWGSYQNYIKWIFVIKIPKKEHFIETDVCCHVWLFLKALATLQNGRWSVGHSSQVDRKRWISLEEASSISVNHPSGIELKAGSIPFYKSRRPFLVLCGRSKGGWWQIGNDRTWICNHIIQPTTTLWPHSSPFVSNLDENGEQRVWSWTDQVVLDVFDDHFLSLICTNFYWL